jgi:hypothetical protein
MKPTPLLLLVPLAWTSCAFAQQAPPQSAAAHGWQQSQNTDAVRAMTYTRFTLGGKFLNSPQTAVPNRPALVLDCIPAAGSGAARGRFLTASLLIGTPLKVIYVEPEEIHGTSYYPKIAVRYRIENRKEESEKWSLGTEKASAAVPKNVVKKILRAHSVTVSAEDESGAPLAIQFDLPDAAAVEAGCNVD